jgi:ABC-type Fe3+-hydroxamate transport system substrate-binding protein
MSPVRAAERSIYEIDIDQLRELSPHLILAQAVCEVCAVPTESAREAARAAEIEADVLSLDAHSIRDILQSVTLIGEATGTAERAEVVVGDLRRRSHEVTICGDALTRLPGPWPERRAHVSWRWSGSIRSSYRVTGCRR